MCVAIPGKVLSVEGSSAKVDFKGSVVPVNIGLTDAKVGDYVLVHAGCAIERMQKSQAEELLEIFSELE